MAEAVVTAMQDCDLALMENHGLVTAADTHAHALQNAEFFELACQIIIHNGDTLNAIPKAEAEHLLKLRSKASGI